MIKVDVKAGICGFNTVIQLTSEDQQHAAIEVTTECPNLKPIE